MDNKNYNVDDILSEIKRKKNESRAKPSAGSASTPEQAAPDFHIDAFPPAREDAVAEPVDSPRARPEPEAPAPSPGFHFQLPEEEPPEAPAQNPLNFDGHVRSITDRARMRQEKGAVRPSAAPPGGFSFNPDNITVPPDVPVEDAHQHTRILPRFSTGRELKLEDIQKLDFGPENVYEDEFGDMEEDYASSIPESGQYDFSEYNSSKNRDDVALDIARTKLWLFIRASVTGVLTLIAFYFALSGKFGALPMPEAIWPEGDTVRMYLLTCTILTAVVAVVNSSAMGGGLISFFRLRANSDSLAAFAMLAAVMQGIFGIARPSEESAQLMIFYFPVACLTMLFNALGKMSMISRIQQNFRVLGSDRDKRAVLSVDSPEFCREFVGETTRRKPTIAYGVKAGFFNDFLALSYSDRYDVGINRSVAPVCLIGALIVGVSTYFLSAQNPGFSAVSAFTAVVCVCATFSSTFIENIPLAKVSRDLTAYGGMISGNKAVEDFCDTKAVILTENDLFPGGHVRLHGIKSFSRGRIDEAILDAASVLCELDGALAPVFLQMINNNKRLLRKVDSIVFENDMGVSAWVDSRRILIGNRKLMQNHGIALPTDAYERGEAAGMQGEPLYLSNSGEVSARFLIGYSEDKDLAVELDRLAVLEKQLIVYTNDANISAHKVWEVYGYPEELITVMPTARHQQYLEMAAPRENAVAEIVYAGKASAMIRAILSCISARTSILTATVIELVQILLGYGFITFLAFSGYAFVPTALTDGRFQPLTIVFLSLYQLIWFAVIFIVQQVRRT